MDKKTAIILILTLTLTVLGVCGCGKKALPHPPDEGPEMEQKK